MAWDVGVALNRRIEAGKGMPITVYEGAVPQPRPYVDPQRLAEATRPFSQIRRDVMPRRRGAGTLDQTDPFEVLGGERGRRIGLDFDPATAAGSDAPAGYHSLTIDPAGGTERPYTGFLLDRPLTQRRSGLYAPEVPAPSGGAGRTATLERLADADAFPIRAPLPVPESAAVPLGVPTIRPGRIFVPAVTPPAIPSPTVQPTPAPLAPASPVLPESPTAPELPKPPREGRRPSRRGGNEKSQPPGRLQLLHRAYVPARAPETSPTHVPAPAPVAPPVYAPTPAPVPRPAYLPAPAGGRAPAFAPAQVEVSVQQPSSDPITMPPTPRPGPRPAGMRDCDDPNNFILTWWQWDDYPLKDAEVRKYGLGDDWVHCALDREAVRNSFLPTNSFRRVDLPALLSDRNTIKDNLRVLRDEGASNGRTGPENAVLEFAGALAQLMDQPDSGEIRWVTASDIARLSGYDPAVVGKAVGTPMGVKGIRGKGYPAEELVRAWEMEISNEVRHLS